jgi:small nuclear ribonucleoprotein B and B'
MNLVLADTEEFRRTKRKSKAAPGAANTQVEAEEKRTLGLTIVRGTQVVSCSVDGPPPADPSARLGAAGPSGAGAAATLAAGPGISKPAGRGLPVGLGGPAAGVGGPPPPMGGFPPGGFPPPGFGGRGGPPGGPRKWSLIFGDMQNTDSLVMQLVSLPLLALLLQVVLVSSTLPSDEICDHSNKFFL